MKKYLTLAAVLGAIAFVSVSYLAHAQQAAAPAAPAAAASADKPAAGDFAKDSDMCNTMASTSSTEGAAPSADEKDASYKKCMMSKGHTEEEMKKAADEKAAKDKEAPKAGEGAPKMDAPAAK